MSIFQDFEGIREKIGHEKYDMIEIKRQRKTAVGFWMQMGEHYERE